MQSAGSSATPQIGLEKFCSRLSRRHCWPMVSSNLHFKHAREGRICRGKFWKMVSQIGPVWRPITSCSRRTALMMMNLCANFVNLHNWIKLLHILIATCYDKQFAYLGPREYLRRMEPWMNEKSFNCRFWCSPHSWKGPISKAILQKLEAQINSPTI